MFFYELNTNILAQLYKYSLIFPFLTCGLITWGNTYQSTLKPIVTLQKKALRIMSFAKYKSKLPVLCLKS